jgi:hypothetical protein
MIDQCSAQNNNNLHRKKGRKDDRTFIGDLLNAHNDGVDHFVDLRVAQWRAVANECAQVFRHTFVKFECYRRALRHDQVTIASEALCDNLFFFSPTVQCEMGNHSIENFIYRSIFEWCAKKKHDMLSTLKKKGGSEKKKKRKKRKGKIAAVAYAGFVCNLHSFWIKNTCFSLQSNVCVC